MLTAKEVVLFAFHGWLPEVQRVCEDAGEAVSLMVDKVAELARECVEAKRKNVALSGQNTDTEAELVGPCAIKYTRCEHLTDAKRRIVVPKTQLDEAQLELDKLACESFKALVDLCDQAVVVEEVLNLEEAPVKRLELDVAAEAKNGQQLLGKH